MSFSLFYSVLCLWKTCKSIYLSYDRCLKSLRLHVVTLTAKRQIQVESYQNGKWGGKNTSKQFLWIKLVWKYYFLVEVIEKEKGNLGHVAQIHVCRQISIMTSLRTQTAYFRKIRLGSQANIDQYYPNNAFIGVTSFNIFMLQKKRKRNNENRACSSFQ